MPVSSLAGGQAAALPLAHSLTCRLITPYQPERHSWPGPLCAAWLPSVAGFGGSAVLASAHVPKVAATGTPQGFLCLALETPCSLQPDV